MSDYTTTPNYGLYKPTPNTDYDLWGDHLNANADKLDQVIRDIAVASGGGAGGGRDIWITDFLPTGQPDGTTDLTSYFQQALDAAAGADPANRGAAPGFARLVVPANPLAYVVGTLNIPSNSHLTIERGATLLLAPNTNYHMLVLVNNATDVLIELYGTLDGNAPAQPGTATPGVNSSCVISAGFVSNTSVVGDKSGLIINACEYPFLFSQATNCVASGISMINGAGVRGGSAGVQGNIQRPNTTGSPYASITITSGTYTGATGLVSLTTNVPHKIVPGQEFSPINLTGTGGIGNAGAPGTGLVGDLHTYTGTGAIFVALPGSSGTTLLYQAGVGGLDATIATGWFDVWAMPLTATITGGSFGSVTTSGGSNTKVTLTTSAAHGLVPDQVAMINITSDAAALNASGAFTLAAGTSGTTIVYVCPKAGLTGTISAGTVAVSTKSYDSGFTDCYLDNINDIAIALYGGCENCYIRNCEISHSNAGAAIYSDRNSGRNIGCEISGCYIHDNYLTGVYISVSQADSIHLNCRIFNNLVANCVRGAELASVDGVDFHDNRFYANKSSPIVPGFTAAAEILILNTASRVNVYNNAIRDAGGGGASGNVLIPITAGTYNSTTGNVSLTRGAGTNLFSGCVIMFANVSGSGAAASLAGVWTCTEGTNGTTTINFQGPVGLGTISITGGSVWPAVYGILLFQPHQCRITNNFIGDHQPTKTMAAALGGLWGGQGYSGENYYGPQFLTGGNFPADQSVYQLQSVQGISYHSVTGYTSGLTMPAQSPSTSFPPVGLTMARNLTLGRGEINFYVGAGQAVPGGFDFIKVTGIYAASGSYTSGTGAVSATTNLAHGVVVGATFTLVAAGGTGADISNLNGTWIATTGTAGTTLNFILMQVVSGSAVPWIGLDITSITGGLINVSTTDGGVIDSTVGVPVLDHAGAVIAPGGSLLANDGLGNTRLGGALVHGAMQTATLAAGGTVTVNPNTSFVLVQNASIATGSVVLPAPAASSYQLAGSELEVRFQNPVGTLTMTAAAGAGVAGPPTTVLSAGSSFGFVLSEPGNIWLPRLPDVSGTAPVGGPYLPLGGGAVTGATTFGAPTTHAAGITVSGGTLTAGTAALTGVLTMSGAGAISGGSVASLVGGSSLITPGATATRPLNTRFGEVLNVKDYGAVGDGVTNDRTAINAAITAANSGNIKVVYFPASANAYIVASNITIPSGIILFAYPGTATIKPSATNGSNPLIFNFGGAGATDVLVYGLIIDGNVTGQTGGGGALNRNLLISVFSSTRVVFDHCRFVNTYGTPLQFSTNCSYCGVRHCGFDNVGAYFFTSAVKADAKQAVSFIDAAEGGSVGNFVENCLFTNVSFDAINQSFQTGMSIRANRAFLGNRQWYSSSVGCAMVFSFGSRGMHIVDNISWQASGASFDLSGEIALTVVGNKSYMAGVNGIGLGNGISYGITTGMHHAVFSGNIVLGSGQNLATANTGGLAFIQGATGGGPITDIVVTGNTFSDHQTTPTQHYGIAMFDLGFGLPTLTGIVIGLSNHMTGNITAPFGSGLSYSTAEGALSVSGGVVATTGLRVNGNAGFNSAAPIAKPTVTGAKGSNAALASLITALAAYGLVTDTTTA